MKKRAFGTTSVDSIRSLTRGANALSMVWRLAVIAGALSVAVVPSVQTAAQTIEARGASLRPGQSVWRDDLALSGPVAVVIGIEEQLAYVYRGGKLLGISTVSTGKRGKGTPTGAFTILQKKVFHRSNLYSNAPMPYMQRLTWTGIAMHAGHLPGYPASHGCIRFPADFAKKLYDATDLGGEVRVVASLGEMPGLPAPAPQPKPRELPPVIVADAGTIARRDDAARVGETSAAPRIEVADRDTAFDAYDAVYASGYGAKGGTN